MHVAVRDVEYHVVDMSFRMPFHFGDATVTDLPHLFARVELDVDGETHAGLAAEGLSPLWFIKDPDVSFEEGIDRMVDAVEAAGSHALDVDTQESVFDLWRAVYDRQREWADGREGTYPPLLWGFGVTLVERAAVDAFCRAEGTTFAAAVRENALGIDPGSVYEELAGTEPAEFLPDEPVREMELRHTVGFADPLTEAELDPEDRLDDGLPQSLESYVEKQGLRAFKIKLVGDGDRDAARLEAIAETLAGTDVEEYRFTLDANEQYDSARAFVDAWESLAADADLSEFLDHLLYVEQPLARDDAFSDETRRAFDGWEGPPVIIDESDDRIDSLGRALECGYDGTSHKNCKGVFKGVVNHCLLEHRRREEGGEYVMSGEDLSTVGPVGLLQDYAVVATLGLDHAERNGHHYFRGMAAFPDDVQEGLLDAHDDLYRRHEEGFAAVDVADGRVRVGSTVDAPFGYAVDLDSSRFTPLEEWTFEPA